jgi:hypothetical protein
MSRGEYTARCAVRDTRRAIERVRKAMKALREASRYWGDIDSVMESDCEQLPELPAEVVYLEVDLDMEYPKRVSRRPASARSRA